MSMRYDAIVVGAGTAGAILAARLSEDSQRSVLLLEAGPDYPDLERLPEEVKFGGYMETHTPQLRGPGGHPMVLLTSDYNWKLTARATPTAPPMPVARGKVTGGSSAINRAGFHRGTPQDYDAWASQGNDQWSFERVLTYFRKIETDPDFHDDFHGTDGPIVIDRARPENRDALQSALYNAGRAAGFPDCPDQNHPDATGVGPGCRNLARGIRLSTALTYLDPARHRLNLTIRPNCTVHSILFDGKRATGVRVESGGETFSVSGDEIILSGGAVASPQLLMLSGIGPADHLKSLGIPVLQDLPGVGQNLKDHPKVWLTWHNRTNQRFSGAGGVALRFSAPDSSFRNDLLISMDSFAYPRANPLVTDDIHRKGDEVGLPRVEMAVAVTRPLSSGEVRLTSTDPTVQPYLDYNYLADSYDLQRMRHGVYQALQLAEHADFRQLIGDRIEPTEADLASEGSLDAWMLREATTYSHISCTCKMGPASDHMAVVDQSGKVRGIDGLRVADASIMPDLVAAAINPTVMVIGEHIADLVRQG